MASTTDRQFPDLGLSNDEVIARYLRQIADGPDCAAYLRAKGFDAWCAMWWGHHARNSATHSLEWDSRNYDEHAMREIYDGIIAHADRSARA